MIGMVALSMRLGVTLKLTPCQEIAERLGRVPAIVLGVIMFLLIACFQSSNNMAVGAALEAFGKDAPKAVAISIIFAINIMIVAFLYLGRDLYRVIEWAMKALVLMMLVAFCINCIVARPSLGKLALGAVPFFPSDEWMLLAALVGTTFSIAGAFYQSYLVREKNWTQNDVKAGMFDSVVGISSLGIISLVIMMTSAAVFGKMEKVPELNSAYDVGKQLQPTFGAWAQAIFGIGILAGAISSFLVNALIGGHILADGLGLGDRIDSPWTRHLTAIALLVGMVIAASSISSGMSRVGFIVFAQSLTVIGGPALAAALIYLGIHARKNNRSAVPVTLLVLACIGFVVTLLLASKTVYDVVGKIKDAL